MKLEENFTWLDMGNTRTEGMIGKSMKWYKAMAETHKSEKNDSI